jgi:hypothetical protein
MAPRNECVDAVLRELDKHGLSAQVEDRSKHVEVSWQYPNGTSRFTIVPKTSSDVRGALNARGEVRRQLRADVALLPTAEVVAFKKAMSLPAVPAAAPDRMVKLEREYDALLDFTFELSTTVSAQAAVIAELQTKLAGIRIAFGPEPVQQQAPVEETAVVGTRRAKGSLRKAVLKAFQDEGAPFTPSEIASKVGAPYNTVAACLWRLNRDNKVKKDNLGRYKLNLAEPSIQKTASAG